MPPRRQPTYNLPEPEFLKELKQINGTPREVLENPELMKLMFPILRADFQICQTHIYTANRPLNCPIVTFGGLEDEICREDLDAWQIHTAKRFSLHMMAGDHFFIRNQEQAILRILSSLLNEIIIYL